MSEFDESKTNLIEILKILIENILMSEFDESKTNLIEIWKVLIKNKELNLKLEILEPENILLN